MGNHYPVTKKLIGKNGYISCDQNINDNQHLYRLLDSLEVECWLWVREVPVSILWNRRSTEWLYLLIRAVYAVRLLGKILFAIVMVYRFVMELDFIFNFLNPKSWQHMTYCWGLILDKITLDFKMLKFWVNVCSSIVCSNVVQAF